MKPVRIASKRQLDKFVSANYPDKWHREEKSEVRKALRATLSALGEIHVLVVTKHVVHHYPKNEQGGCPH